MSWSLKEQDELLYSLHMRYIRKCTTRQYNYSQNQCLKNQTQDPTRSGPSLSWLGWLGRVAWDTLSWVRSRKINKLYWKKKSWRDPSLVAHSQAPANSRNKKKKRGKSAKKKEEGKGEMKRWWAVGKVASELARLRLREENRKKEEEQQPPAARQFSLSPLSSILPKKTNQEVFHFPSNKRYFSFSSLFLSDGLSLSLALFFSFSACLIPPIPSFYFFSFCLFSSHPLSVLLFMLFSFPLIPYLFFFNKMMHPSWTCGSLSPSSMGPELLIAESESTQIRPRSKLTDYS